MQPGKWSVGALAIATAGLFSFKIIFTGTLKGRVTPADGASMAWIISVTDTLKVPITAGTFEVGYVKAGTYRVIIEARPPYRNTAKEGITVQDGQTNDIGEIKLSR